MSTLGTGQVIDPRLSSDLMAMLDAHEVPHEEGALLWEIEKRGYWMYLSGPSESNSVESRWEVRAGDIETDSRRAIRRGQTARIALARVFAWMVDQERSR